MHPGPDGFLQQVVGARWRVVEVLGPTEHGAAFRVETVEDGRPARLELWDLRHVQERGELARFEREARTLSRLRHERCASVLAFGVHEGRPYLVSELPAGKPLRDELGKPELTVPRALGLGLQLCEGLRHLHRHGVVHRALTPGNIWISQTAAADQLNIGLPRFGPTADAADAIGDRFYLPPHRSGARLDHRADLYAAGALLYVMCTGREPPAETVAAIAGGGPVPPPRDQALERGISEGLERVILRAMARSPDVRFGTADELMAALQSAGASPTTPKRRPAQGSRGRTAVVAVAFAAVAILGARALRTGGGHEPTTSPGAPAAETAPAGSATPAAPAAVAAPAEQAPRPAPVLPKAPVKPAAIAAAPAAPRPPEPTPAAAPQTAPQPTPKAAPQPAPKAAPQPAPKTAAEPAPKAPAEPFPKAPAEPFPKAPAEPARAEAAPQVAATTAGTPSEGERREIWSLIDRGRLDEGSARIKTLVANDPDAAWPRFALGVLYYRRYWRGDAVKQWQFALARDPEIRQDPQFGAYLCFMLDDTWKAAGMTDLLTQLGAKAIPLVEHCAATAKTPRLRSSAARTLEQLHRPGQRSRR